MTDFPQKEGNRDRRFRGDKHDLSDLNIAIALEMIEDPELADLRERDAPLMDILRHPKVRRRIGEVREHRK